MQHTTPLHPHFNVFLTSSNFIHMCTLSYFHLRSHELFWAIINTETVRSILTVELLHVCSMF